MTPGLSRIGQIAMNVRDLDRAIAFYRDALGIPFLFQAPPKMAFFDCGGTRLLLGVPEDNTSGHGSGSILYYAVDDIKATHHALVGRGVKFKADPHLVAKLPDREVWLAEFDDTEGNMLALMSEPRL